MVPTVADGSPQLRASNERPARRVPAGAVRRIAFRQVRQFLIRVKLDCIRQGTQFGSHALALYRDSRRGAL
jgi:hypothetical protein